jgi:hypothetical protein
MSNLAGWAFLDAAYRRGLGPEPQTIRPLVPLPVKLGFFVDLSAMLASAAAGLGRFPRTEEPFGMDGAPTAPRRRSWQPSGRSASQDRQPPQIREKIDFLERQ